MTGGGEALRAAQDGRAVLERETLAKDVELEAGDGDTVTVAVTRLG